MYYIVVLCACVCVCFFSVKRKLVYDTIYSEARSCVLQVTYIRPTVLAEEVTAVLVADWWDMAGAMDKGLVVVVDSVAYSL